MRILLLLCAAAWLWPLNSPVSRAAKLLRGRCHMDVCTWFSVEETDLVGANTKGALFKVTLRT